MCWTFKYNCFSLRASSNSLPYHLKSQAKFLPSKLVSLGSTTLLQLLALPGGMHLASAHNKFPFNYTSGRKKMLWLFFSQNRFKNKGKGSEKKKKKREQDICRRNSGQKAWGLYFVHLSALQPFFKQSFRSRQTDSPFLAFSAAIPRLVQIITWYFIARSLKCEPLCFWI